MVKKILECISCGRKEFTEPDPYGQKKCNDCGKPMKVVGGKLQTTLK